TCCKEPPRSSAYGPSHRWKRWSQPRTASGDTIQTRSCPAATASTREKSPMTTRSSLSHGGDAPPGSSIGYAPPGPGADPQAARSAAAAAGSTRTSGPAGGPQKEQLRRSGGGREPQQQVPLAPEVRQRSEYIHGTEGARSYPARGEITGAAERLSGYRAGAGRLESLRECRRRDAGKRITASAG